MTPANPDALADARELIRQSLKVGAPGLSEAAREAVVRSIMLKLEGKVLAPILAEKEAAEARAAQLQAEVEALKAEPTDAMVWAGACAFDYPSTYMSGPSEHGKRAARRIYQAMIRAALAPNTTEGRTDRA